MKKIILVLCIVTVVCAIFAACDSFAKVEGTWYSVVDATMYNFCNGEITVSGVTVGQY